MTTTSASAEHLHEVAAGQRFEFGRNWARFLQTLTPDRIRRSEAALQAMLGRLSLTGHSFLDLGSGSGLSSLAARNLGAVVVSVDYDPESVACTAELKRRFYSGDPHWRVLQGSALDRPFLQSLGQFDIVYSWGVLHHTGAMWRALEYVTDSVRPGGTLFVAIYNDQGKPSRRWLTVKRLYNRLPRGTRWPLVLGCSVKLGWRSIVKDFLKGRPFYQVRTYGAERGMSYWTDVVDWVGGYPFEVAKPDQIFEFYRDRGFVLEQLKTEGGDLGCNQFVFRRLTD
jgi:2-polyprenyl-6-hydroxyphenyl methylase/3-demethylubiquinone-9 3-methyltransferase